MKRQASIDLKSGSKKPKYLILQMPEIKIQSDPVNPQEVQNVTVISSKMNANVPPETPNGFDIREFLKVDTPTADDVNAKSKGLLRRQDTVSAIL